MDIEDLKYLSLEGGGGKGAVYLGAIKALEEKLATTYKDDAIGNKSAILDYQVPYNSLIPNDKPSTRILGIAGASAGAITAFPLALGLNSNDIEAILKGYEFEKEFMSETLHEGKYRMVGKKPNGTSKILIAEDKNKKLGEKKIETFKFDFIIAQLRGVPSKKIGNNFVKSIIRNQVVSFIFQTILNGFLHIYEPINEFIKKIKKQGKITSIMSDGEIDKVEDSIELGPFSVKFFVVFDFIANQIFSLYGKVFNSPVKLSNSSLKIVLKILLKVLPKKIGGFIPRDNIIGAISNLIWDRGVYAGFEVREFFFKILLLSLSKDTHFRRCLLNNDKALATLGITKQDLLDIEGFINGFKILENDDEELESTIKKLCLSLPEFLTFENFYATTKINLSCCVSNATTGQPTYFSSYFTPNYPVIEAMGASMSFPLAFKPVYNEANVIIDKHESLDVKIKEENFITQQKNISKIYKESFSIDQYKKFHNLILAFIKEKCELSFSLNSNLSFRSYLPYLRAIIEKNDFKGGFKYKNTYSKEKISYTEKEIKKLSYFYYNSAFKGLHIDGGATNNLPIAVHTYLTSKNSPLDYKHLQNMDIKKNVLSLKLDNSFPYDLKEIIFDTLKNYKKGKTLNNLSNWKDKIAQYTLIDKIKKDLRLEKAYKNLTENNTSLYKELSNLHQEVWVKICNEVIEEYKLSKKSYTPWNKQILFINAVMSPLQFGMDQGQIEDIQDNENIIPLYCFGLDVFDFDLTSEKLEPLVNIANEEAKKTVENILN